MARALKIPRKNLSRNVYRAAQTGSVMKTHARMTAAPGRQDARALRCRHAATMTLIPALSGLAMTALIAHALAVAFL